LPIFHAEHVDADDQLAPEATGQHVPPRMGARVFGREEAVLHLLPHPGVVLGELRERPLAPEEEAAVPDVRRHQRAAHHRARGEGGPHAAQLGHHDRLVVELEVGLLDGAPAALRQRPAALDSLPTAQAARVGARMARPARRLVIATYARLSRAQAPAIAKQTYASCCASALPMM